MAADDAGNDLDAVGIPITGFAAIAPLEQANVVSPSEGGTQTLVLPTGYRKLGLIKSDGGYQPTDEADGDPIEFWQQGYEIGAGTANSTLQIGLAQNDPVVREIVRGVAPDANGHIFVDASGSDEQYLLFTEEVFKTKTGRFFVERTNGVVTVGVVERDQSERGAVRGWNTTFNRLPHAWFENRHYSEWVINAPVAGTTPDPGE